MSILSSIFKSPFVLRSTHNQALEALEDANRETQKAIHSLFDIHQKHQRAMLLAEKKRLTDLAHVMEIHIGPSCEIGGVSFRYRD